MSVCVFKVCVCVCVCMFERVCLGVCVFTQTPSLGHYVGHEFPALVASKCHDTQPSFALLTLLAVTQKRKKKLKIYLVSPNPLSQAALQKSSTTRGHRKVARESHFSCFKVNSQNTAKT